MTEQTKTRREVLEHLLEKLEKGEAVLIVGLADDKRIPTIHNFYPKKYWESIEHHGWGFFEGKTEHGTFSFDGGGAMIHHSWNDGKSPRWISWSPLRANQEVLKDLGYDCEKVATILKNIIPKLA
jgi:hypothetical protein